MEEKKVLFIIPTFGVGGTLSSLKALLSLIDSVHIKVDVFALYKVGPNSMSIPNANVLKESIWLSTSIKESKGLKRYLQLLLRGIKIILSKFRIDVTPFYIRMGVKELHLEHYDCIISYSEDLTKFVSLFPIKHKIAWTHSVYSRYKELNGGKDEIDYYNCFDYIVCVSEYAKNDFISVYASLRDKVRVIYNCCDENRLIKLSRAYSPVEYANKDHLRQFTIVSVGRLDPVKQFSYIPQIAGDVKQKVGSCFKWLIIGGPCGDGKEELSICSKINEYEVGDVVFLIGMKKNPYPYIAQSNVLVHTSSSETFGMVVQEALALDIPAIVNDYGSANETVINGVNGIIVPLNRIADILIKMITVQDYYQTFKKQVSAVEHKKAVFHTEAPIQLMNLL